MSDQSPTQRPCPWEERDIQEAPVEDQVLSPEHRCTCSTSIPTAEGAVRGTACSTHSPTAEGAVRGPACSTHSQTAEGAVRGPACSTLSQTAEGTVRGPACSTLSQTAKGSVGELACSTHNQTTEGTVRGPACSTHNQTTEGTVRGPACSTHNQTAEGTVRGPACSTLDRTAEGAVRELACSTPSQTAKGSVRELACSTPSRTAEGAVRELACSTPSRTAEGAVRGPYVRLNVGGALFLCSLRVLKSHESRLRDMFSGKTEVMVDSEGWVLVDRCGKHFSLILDFLRDGSVSLPQSRLSLQQIHREAQYYGLTGLDLLCQTALQKSLPEPPLCVIPVVTSRKEEEALICSSTKPVVKLVYNRSNNKYSYTSSSDDNLLRNMELFERLSLSFGSRLLFLKNVTGDDICCWSFYCQGRQVSRVCCCSILCSTDRKHTKVEFPEARLYEETLNTLLFETMPDQHLLEATRRRYPHSCQSEEEEGGGPGLALL